MLQNRHNLVTFSGYTLEDIDNMDVYEFEMTLLLSVETNKKRREEQ